MSYRRTDDTETVTHYDSTLYSMFVPLICFPLIQVVEQCKRLQPGRGKAWVECLQRLLVCFQADKHLNKRPMRGNEHLELDYGTGVQNCGGEVILNRELCTGHITI